MPKILLPLIGMAALAAVALLAHRAEAAVSAAPSGVRASLGEASIVEPARTCARRRVCGPRGCVWRTVCRRW